MENFVWSCLSFTTMNAKYVRYNRTVCKKGRILYKEYLVPLDQFEVGVGENNEGWG